MISAKGPLEDFWLDITTDRLKNAWELPFNCTNQQLEAINEFCAPIVLKPSTTNIYPNSHFFQATLLVMAEKFLSVKGENGLSKIEIGPNYRHVAEDPTKHFCTLKSGRDQSRILTTIAESGMSQLGLAELTKLYQGAGCTRGAENCFHPAEVLIANNVMYDVDHKTLEMMFKNHGARIGYFAMMLPDELPNKMSGANTRWKYNITYEKDTVSMHFFDQSWGYKHKYATWLSWVTTDVYQGKEFNLLFERSRAFGNMWIIRVTRVTESAELSHVIVNPFLHGMVKIYNYLPYLSDIANRLGTKKLFRLFLVDKEYFDKIKKTTNFWYIPAEIIAKVIDFCFNRRDNEIDRTPAGMMLVASIQKIIISHFTVQAGFQILDRDFGPIVMNVFLRALIMRANSTKETGYFIRNIQQLQLEDITWMDSIKRLWKILEPFHTNETKNALAVYGISKEHFLVYTFLLGQEESESFIKSSAIAHPEKTTLPTQIAKPFTFNPWKHPGFCLDECIEVYTGKSIVRNLGPDPIFDDVEDFLNTKRLTMNHKPHLRHIDIHIADGHAMINTTSEFMCEHYKAYKMYMLDDERHFETSQMPYDSEITYLQESDNANKNNAKTRWVLQEFVRIQNRYARHEKKSKYNFLSNDATPAPHMWYQKRNNTFAKKLTIINFCAAPFNDRYVWDNIKHIKVIHNIVRTDGVEGLPPLYDKNHEGLVGKNLCCYDCIRSLPEHDLFYADVGNDLEIEDLPSFTNRCLLLARCGKLRKHGLIVVKIRRFTDMLKQGDCGTMVNTIRKHYNLYRDDSCAPDEVFATNYARPGQLHLIGDVIEVPLPKLAPPEKFDIITTIPPMSAATFIDITAHFGKFYNPLTLKELAEKVKESTIASRQMREASAPQEDDVIEEEPLPDEEEASAPERDSDVDSNANTYGSDEEQEEEEQQQDYAVRAAQAVEEARTLREKAMEMDREWQSSLGAVGKLVKPSLAARSAPLVIPETTSYQMDFKCTLEEATIAKLHFANTLFDEGEARTSGTIYGVDKSLPAITTQELQKGGNSVQVTKCTIAQAIYLTQFFQRVHYVGDHTGKTWFGEGKLYEANWYTEDWGEVELYVTPFHKSRLEDDDVPYLVDNILPDVIKIYRSDIPNIGFEIKSAEVFQIVDDACPCTTCKLPTYDGIVTGVKNNKVYGAGRKLKPLDFKKVIHVQNAKLHMEKTILTREMDETKGKFAEPHKQFAAAIKDSTWKQSNEMWLVEGTFGSGKTVMATLLLKDVVDIVVCPTRELAKDYKKSGMISYSWAMGATIANGKKVLVDEVYCMDPRVMQHILSVAEEVYAIGDRDQMKGGGKKFRTQLRYLDELIPLSSINKRMTSFSTPHDCVVAVNSKWGLNVKTLSRVVNSVNIKICRNKRELPKICRGDCSEKHKHVKGACFDTAHANNVDYPTVATVQGLRDDEFNLFVSVNSGVLIDQVHGQHVVAISRHRKVLNVWVDNQVIANKLAIPTLLDKHSCRVGRRDKWNTPYGNCDIKDANFTIADFAAVQGKEQKAFRMLVDNNTIKYNTNDRMRRLNAAGEGDVYDFTVPTNYEASQRQFGIVSLPVTVPDIPDMDEVEVEDERYMLEKINMSIGVGGSSGLADAAMVNVAPTSSQPVTPIRRVQINRLRAPLPGKEIHVKMANELISTQNDKSATVLATRQYGMQQENNLNHMLHTATERYGAVVRKKMDDDAAFKYANELWAGLSKFVNVDAFEKITVEEHAIKKAAALQRVCAKQRYPNLPLFGETYESTEKISGFNKQQFKAKVGEETWLNMKETGGEIHIKGGQPVSAQAKTINEICMPYISFAEAQINKHAKEGVFLGYGHSKSRFRRLVKRRLTKVSKHADAKFVQCLSIDISEQDTTKHRGKRLANEMILRACGTPEVVMQILSQPNVFWRFNNTNVQTDVKDQFQSGRPDTIENNTTDTMMEVGRCFEFEALKLALFQGDDVHLRGIGFKRNDRVFDNFKIDDNPIGEFISFLVTSDDIYLDIPRICCKLLSREFTTYQRVEELRMAMKDLIELHPSAADRYTNQIICAAKYKKNLGDIQILYEYMQAFASQRDNPIDLNPRRGQAENFQTLLATFNFN